MKINGCNQGGKKTYDRQCVFIFSESSENIHQTLKSKNDLKNKQ